MKMNPRYVIICSVIILFIFFITVFSSKSFTPYDEKTVFSHMYPYEGFDLFNDKTEYTLNTTGKDDSLKSYLIDSDATDCKKVYGLDGLFCSPNAKSEKIDIFSDVKSDPTCSGNSSGYRRTPQPRRPDRRRRPGRRRSGGSSPPEPRR